MANQTYWQFVEQEHADVPVESTYACMMHLICALGQNLEAIGDPVHEIIALIYAHGVQLGVRNESHIATQIQQTSWSVIHREMSDEMSRHADGS